MANDSMSAGGPEASGEAQQWSGPGRDPRDPVVIGDVLTKEAAGRYLWDATEAVMLAARGGHDDPDKLARACDLFLRTRDLCDFFNKGFVSPGKPQDV